MKVECPYKDWEGDNSLLPIHLQEIHGIIADSTQGSYANPIMLNKSKPKKKDFFMANLNENLNSKYFWITAFAIFILGVIFANSV